MHLKNCTWQQKGSFYANFRGNLLEATLGLLASNYVFMYNYLPSLNIFFLYLQKSILKISDGKKLPSSVITFVNEIDSLPKKGYHKSVIALL